MGSRYPHSSGERSDTITGTELEDIAVKGRDFVSYLSMLTGVVDTNGNRDAMQRNALSGIHINLRRNSIGLRFLEGLRATSSASRCFFAHVRRTQQRKSDIASAAPLTLPHHKE